MFTRQGVTILLVLMLMLVPTGLAAAQGGGNGGGGPGGGNGGGGGPPSDTPGGGPSGDEGGLLTVSGNLIYETADGTWWMYNVLVNGELNERVKIDFGPEFYFPYPCLEHITNAMLPTYETIQFGKLFIGTFAIRSEPGLQWMLAEAAAPAFGYQLPNGNGKSWAHLAPRRPYSGEFATVYGRTELKADEVGLPAYYLVLVWAINYAPGPVDGRPYGDGWYWWRGDGQPWMKMQFLECPQVSEGE